MSCKGRKEFRKQSDLLKAMDWSVLRPGWSLPPSYPARVTPLQPGLRHRVSPWRSVVMARGSSPSPLWGGLGQRLIVHPGEPPAVCQPWPGSGTAGACSRRRTGPALTRSGRKGQCGHRRGGCGRAGRGWTPARCPETVTEGVRPGSDGTWSVFSSQ